MHPSVATVLAALRSAGAEGEVHELEESARTAKDAAEALGCEVGAIASSLVFMADEAPLLVMTSGAHRVDEALVAQAIGASTMRRATPDEVRVATGFAIGGVAPVGHPAPIRALVDDALSNYDVLWAAAGHGHAVFPTTYAELITLTGGTPTVVNAAG
jgi:prolyl-tRNA editing enzyme YbaK/EbsC (Cys-tRNA(Pro) deacylase)